MRLALTRRRPATRGYVLITALWIGLALSLAVAAYLSSAREHALVVRAEISALRAEALARSGLNLALADLSQPDATAPRDGRQTEVTVAEGVVRYAIQDEAGKIDLRHAPSQMLIPILRRIGAMDGMDAFDASNVAQALEQAARDGTSPNTVSAALRAAGMGANAATLGQRYLTFFGFGAQVNPLTASIEVLQSVPGLGPGDALDIHARRNDGRPLPRLGSASTWLATREGPAYTIAAEARLANGATARMTALVVRNGQSFRSGRARYDILLAEIER